MNWQVEYGKYGKSILTPLSQGKASKSPKKWVAPPPGVYKINADSSLADEGWAGLGVVARDHNGNVVFAASGRIKARWLPVVAEVKALVLAAKLGRRYGLENIILETDCQSIVSRLSKGASHLTDLDSILGDVLQICSSFTSISWSHVGREGNFVAHHLARIIPFGDLQVWENHTPTDITPYVNMDYLSF